MKAREELAREIAEMVRAHEAHRPNLRDPKAFSCSGIQDPIEKSWCQFHGTGPEQHAHLIERIDTVIQRHTSTEWGRRVKDNSRGNGHLAGYVSSTYATREKAEETLYSDQEIVERIVSGWEVLDA